MNGKPGNSLPERMNMGQPLKNRLAEDHPFQRLLKPVSLRPQR